MIEHDRDKEFKQDVHRGNFTVEDGEIYGIIGMSGAGEEYARINMIEKPMSGEVHR